MHGKSCRDSGQTHGEQEEAGVLPTQTCLENERPKDPSFLTANDPRGLLPDVKGVQLALHRAPPGVHGRKEARGWMAGGRK